MRVPVNCDRNLKSAEVSNKKPAAAAATAAAAAAAVAAKDVLRDEVSGESAARPFPGWTERRAAV